MKLLDFALLTDENIHPGLVAFLRRRGHDVRDVKENDLIGSADMELIRLANAEHRVIVTHDADFGRLAIARGESLTGILYLRPGHLEVGFSQETIEFLYGASGDLEPPFVLVGERSGTQVKMRLRKL